MKNTFAVIGFLLMLIIPTLAQDDTSVCNSPFLSEVPEADLLIAVNDSEVSSEMFANRMRFEHAYNAIKYEIRVAQINSVAQASDTASLIANDAQIRQINSENDDALQLGFRVLSDLISDAIVWDYARDNALMISSDDFDASIDDFFGLGEANSDEREATLNDFSQHILMTGTSPSEITTFFCRQALYSAVQDAVIGNPETTLYADTDHILVSSEEVALDIIALLNGGEDFASLAQDLSLDVASAERGGALGWQPLVFYVRDYALAVREGDLNSILEPVQTRFGWHVIRLNGREERPIDEDMRELIISSLFSRWREEQVDSASVTIHPDWQSFVPEL